MELAWNQNWYPFGGIVDTRMVELAWNWYPFGGIVDTRTAELAWNSIGILLVEYTKEP
jgi:hypothetical protein